MNPLVQLIAERSLNLLDRRFLLTVFVCILIMNIPDLNGSERLAALSATGGTFLAIHAQKKQEDKMPKVQVQKEEDVVG